MICSLRLYNIYPVKHSKRLFKTSEREDVGLYRSSFGLLREQLLIGNDRDMDSVNKIEPHDKACLEQVFNVFGAYTAWALREKTHKETPWLKATNNGKILKRPIDRNDMIEYFKEHYIGD